MSRFAQYRYPRILRVLHREPLVNVIGGQSVPNCFVYAKPWYRDAAMMAMCFAASDNLDVIRDWVLRLRAPYDRKKAGETEADNLGQALYLISLWSDCPRWYGKRTVASFAPSDRRGSHESTDRWA